MSELSQRAEEVKESDGFDLLNQILAVKTRKASKNGGQTDRSLRSQTLRSGADFRWQDIQRVLTRQYDRNSFGLPLRDSEIPTNYQSEEFLDRI